MWITNSRFTNSRSLPSPQTLSLETVWIFSIVSRCDSFEGKGRKMPRMEIEIVRQATRRTHGLAVPWAHRLRRADRRDGFQQRPSQQGQTNPPLQDRKSTRLNSSHLGISYAVFCLKIKIHMTVLM